MDGAKRNIGFLELGQSALLLIILHYFFKNEWLIYAGLALVALGLVSWHFRYYHHFIWKWINTITQTIGEFIFLLVIYVVLVIPMGLAFQLRHRKKGETRSTLQDVDKAFTAEELKKSW